MNFEIKVLDQFVNEEGSDQEKECWNKIKAALCEANACPQLCDGWRDPRSELPEHGAMLVYFRRGNYADYAIALCQGAEWEWIPSDTEVIAWMPLPEPPKV
jgi:hypothetical protein